MEKVTVAAQHDSDQRLVVDLTQSEAGVPDPFSDAREAREAVQEALTHAEQIGDRERAAALRRVLVRLASTVEHFEERMAAAERESALDPLTGLANRRAWRDAVRAAEERCRRGAAPAVVAVVDLDGFKEINDTQGHAAGDRILRALARTLTGAVRGGDTVARTGGDEFAVLAFGTDDAETVAHRLAEAVAEAGLHASVGAADRPADGGLEAAWVLADEAMYASKARRGRGGVTTRRDLEK